MDWIAYQSGRSRGGCRRAGGLILIWIAVWIAIGSAAAQDAVIVPVRDEHGEAVTSGVVLFCPEDAPCIEIAIESDGSIGLDRTLLKPGGVYAVLIYAENLSLRYAASEWIYGATADAAAVPELSGLPAQGLQVVLPLFTPAHDEEPIATREADVASPESYRRFLGAVLVPFMLGGNFGTDPTALGGVTDVAPGIGFLGSYRFGFTRHRTLGRSSVAFKELSLTYAQNRYQTDPIQPTGDGSDLTFHRFLVSFGLGRLWRRSQASLTATAGYGGLYDGQTLVEYRDRSYGMWGLGLQARFVQRILGKDGGVTVGLLGQLEIMHYFAEPGEDDHWYGWAPSAAFGVGVY